MQPQKINFELTLITEEEVEFTEKNIEELEFKILSCLPHILDIKDKEDILIESWSIKAEKNEN